MKSLSAVVLFISSINEYFITLLRWRSATAVKRAMEDKVCDRSLTWIDSIMSVAFDLTVCSLDISFLCKIYYTL